MTPDDPDDFHGALKRLFGAVGWTRSAEVAGASESLLRKWADPQAARNPPHMETCLLIEEVGIRELRFSVDMAPFSAMWRRRLLKASNREQRLKAVVHELHDVVAATGDLTRLVDQAIADNKLTPEEKRAIRRSAEDLRREIDELVRSLDTSSPVPLPQ